MLKYLHGAIPSVMAENTLFERSQTLLNDRGGHSGAVEQRRYQRRCFFSSGSAAVFFYQQRKAAAPLFLRRSNDQRSSASVKKIDLPLPLLQKKKILKTMYYAAI